MKNRAVIATVVLSLATVITSDFLGEESFKRYQIESGIIEYSLSGNRKGTEIVYFDDWGRREAKYSKTELSMMGITQKSNTLTLLDGVWIYNINLDGKTGTKMSNSMLKDLSESSSDKDLTEVGEEMMVRMGGKKIGTEEIQGKMCDVWEIKNMNTKTWVWKGVTLKTVTKMAGIETLSTAVRFEANAKVPEEKFAIPADVTITEGQDFKDLFKNLKSKKQ